MRAEQHRAAARFGLGASARDLAAMGDDPRGWLIAQVRSPRRDQGFIVSPSHTSLTKYGRALMSRRRAQQSADGDEQKIADIEETTREFRSDVREVTIEHTLGRFNYAVQTATPYRERLVHFWSNHFAVSRSGKPQIIGSCLAYENEAIRASMDGHFADLLVRVVSHPVMLLYLDNALSIGPDSLVGRRRKRGLNENLAREVLELHTLGVEGGYGQNDVKALASMLTGWTVGNERLARFGGDFGKFVFVEAMHQPGRFRLLDKTYEEDGAGQAERALRDLAEHPSTANFLAAKLARHFIADKPPAAAIDRLAAVFRKTAGHLPSVHAALVQEETAWQAEHAKFKNPNDYLLSAYRGIDRTETRNMRVAAVLRTMNQLQFSAPSPQGWPDTTEHWGSPTALKQRVEWAVAFSNAVAGNTDVQQVAAYLVAPHEQKQIQAALARAASSGQALGLILASPGFQWR